MGRVLRWPQALRAFSGILFYLDPRRSTKNSRQVTRKVHAKYNAHSGTAPPAINPAKTPGNSCRIFSTWEFLGIQKPFLPRVFSMDSLKRNTVIWKSKLKQKKLVFWIVDGAGEIQSTWTLLAYTTSTAHIPQSPVYPAATSHKLSKFLGSH